MTHASRIRAASILCALLAACGGSGGSGEGSDNDGDSSGDAGPAQADSGTSQGGGCSSSKDCQADQVCDTRSGQCRAPLTCEAAACALHQECEEAAAGKDARCGECEAGYKLDIGGRSCRPLASCEPSAPGSIAQQCAAENKRCEDGTDGATCRGCVDGAQMLSGQCVADNCDALTCTAPQACTLGSSGASCAGCVEGYSWSDTAKRCLVTCAALECKADQRCAPATATQDATCVSAVKCPTGKIVGTSGECVQCEPCYDFTGTEAKPKTGVVGIGNRGVVHSNICVCELKDGYFQSTRDGAVHACDADGDEWVNALATDLQGTPFDDEARCTIPRIESFVLRSDDLRDGTLAEGVTRDREVTVSELLTLLSKQGLNVAETAYERFKNRDVLQLVEHDVLDERAKFNLRFDSDQDPFKLSAYGSTKDAARLRPAQVNPLTKMCNHDNDDLNMDGSADVEQAQGGSYLRSKDAPRFAPFFHMAYFLELAEGHFEDPDKDGLGKFVITERPRRDTQTGGIAPLPWTLKRPYEQDCMRSRDASYKGFAGEGDAEPAPGYDFAQFQCSADIGGCSVGSTDKVEAHVAYDGRAPKYASALEALASSTASAPRPWDAAPDEGYDEQALLWPGMNHHSQFKCVSTAEPAPSAPRPATDTEWTWYDCSLVPNGPDASPDVDCVALDAEPEDHRRNHWVSAAPPSYVSSALYPRGCIDEAVEWEFACPRWSGRWVGINRETQQSEENKFKTQPLSTGEYTCQSNCDRGGMFIAIEQGGVCCYGNADGGQACDPSDFSFEPSQGVPPAVLLCTVDQATSDALQGDPTMCQFDDWFNWADASSSAYDPRVLVWARGTDAPNLSTWK